MKSKIGVCLTVLAMFGCAKVSVEAPKDPIKLDVTMRLDIYQHIEKDIDAIENMVNGGNNPGPQSWMDMFVTPAYAEEDLSPEVETAALRRKDRNATITSWEAKGVIGENAAGLVEIVGQDAGADVENLVSDENSDRMVIYKGIAAKNGTSVASVQQIYSQRLQNDAPSGTSIQVVDSSSGQMKWVQK